MSYTNKCLFCGKNFTAKYADKKYCTRECYAKTKLGKVWGGAVSKKGKKIGSYSEKRIAAMSNAKKEQHLKRALEHPEILRLDEARKILKANYMCSLSILAKVLNYPTTGHRYIADVHYALVEKEGLELCKLDLAEPIVHMNLKQHNWYLKLIATAKNWNDFVERFESEYKEIGVRMSAAKYSFVLDFVQKLNIKTSLFRQDWSKNIFGYSTESLFRSYLEEQKLSFKEQVTLKQDSENYYRADFIVEDKLIVEVNGDYWHGYGKTIESADERVQKRILQDFKKYEFYKEQNYNYLIIWEHELQNKSIIIKRLEEKLNDASNYQRIT